VWPLGSVAKPRVFSLRKHAPFRSLRQPLPKPPRNASNSSPSDKKDPKEIPRFFLFRRIVTSASNQTPSSAECDGFQSRVDRSRPERRLPRRTFAAGSSALTISPLLGVPLVRRPAIYTGSGNARPERTAVDDREYQLLAKAGSRSNLCLGLRGFEQRPDMQFTIVGITPKGFGRHAEEFVTEVWLPMSVYDHGSRRFWQKESVPFWVFFLFFFWGVGGSRGLGFPFLISCLGGGGGGGGGGTRPHGDRTARSAASSGG